MHIMCIKAGLAINDIFLISIYITDAHVYITIFQSLQEQRKECAEVDLDTI